MELVRRPKGFPLNRNRAIGQQAGQRERRLARFQSSTSLAAARVTLDVRRQKGTTMNGTTNNWWWLPGSGFVLAGILFMVAAIESRPAVWIPIGVVFIILGGMNLRRRAPGSDSNAGPGT